MKGLHHTGIVIICTLLCAGVGLVIPGIVLASAPEDQETLDLAVAEPRSVTRKGAVLEPASVIDLHNNAGHGVAVLFIAAQGKAVSKGTLLVELDSSSLWDKQLMMNVQFQKTQAELAAARASLARTAQESPAQAEVAELGLAVAEGALNTFVQAEYPLQVKTAEQEIAITNDKIASASARLERLKQHTEDPEAAEHLEELELVLLEMKGQLKTAEYKLHLLQAVLHDQKTNELRWAIAQRKLELMRVRHQASHAKEQGEATLAMIQTRYHMESDRLERLKGQIAACKVYAPQDGTVLYPKMGLKPGMPVRDRQLLLRLTESKRFKLSVRVGLPAAQSVATGQSVMVRIDAFPQRTFPGRITRIRVLPNQPPEAVEGLVTVLVDDSSRKLRVGMSGMIEFGLLEKKDSEGGL